MCKGRIRKKEFSIKKARMVALQTGKYMRKHEHIASAPRKQGCRLIVGCARRNKTTRQGVRGRRASLQCFFRNMDPWRHEKNA